MNVLNTDQAPGAIGPYSQGFAVNGFVFTSGQIPVDPASGEVPEGIAAQTEQSCKNVGAILAAAGAGFDKVFKTTCFLADIADMALSLLRRYTEYNHYNGPGSIEVSAFRVGDIFIDPPRRIVEVRGRKVNLKHREFSLLLYFMRNPNIVLSSEQICEHTWGMTHGYNNGVAHPIYLLRKYIEPNPETPTYIQTVQRSGYRFTPNYVETCDIRHNSVIEVS